MSWFEAHQVERPCEKKKVYAHKKKETFPQGEPQQTELNKTVAFCNKKFCRFRSPVRVFFFGKNDKREPSRRKAAKVQPLRRRVAGIIPKDNTSCDDKKRHLMCK